jgi:toxin FitB
MQIQQARSKTKPMWILDTNVISETRLTVPNPDVIAFIESQHQRFYTTEVNIAEIGFGVLKFQGTAQGKSLENWLTSTVRPWFKGNILGVTEACLTKWLQIGRDVQKKRGPTPSADLLIAAIALDAEFKVATRDVAPFIASGVPTFNPWTGERFNGA